MGLVFTLSVGVSGTGVHMAQLPSDDPSTIFLRMPVADSRCSTAPLDYYPSYAKMTPEQRWRYLHWLENPCRPISIGYVFVYYYGLERQLLLGDFDAAFEEVLMLRQHHDHGSFHHYSANALACSAILRDKSAKLALLLSAGVVKGLSSPELVLAYNKGMDLTASSLLAASYKIPKAKRLYLKEHAPRLHEAVEASLVEKYGSPFFPFAGRYHMDQLPTTDKVVFANISLPSEYRAPTVPDFLKYEPFLDDAREILGAAHERVKRSLAEKRRAAKKTRPLQA